MHYGGSIPPTVMFNEIVDVKMRLQEIAGKQVQFYLIAKDTEANL